MNVLISIVVPVYNLERYIRECIISILNQEYQNLEVIIVDDGSTDSSGKICDELAVVDPRVKVIHKKNGGLVSARKAGISEATGEYVFNIDGDDYIGKDMLLSICRIIDAYHPDAIAFNCIHFSESNKQLIKNICEPGLYTGSKLSRIKKNMICSSKVKGLNLGELYFSIWSKVCKREILTRHQLAVPNDIVKGEDVAVTVPFICEVDSLYVSDLSGYFYRNTQQSMINTFKEHEMENLEVLISYLDNALGEDYYQNINSYIAYMAKTFVSNAVKHFDNYKEFLCCIETRMPNKFLYRMKNINARCGLREKVWLSLISHKCCYIIWKFLK